MDEIQRKLRRLAREKPELMGVLVKEARSLTASEKSFWASFGGAVLEGEKSASDLVDESDIEQAEYEASAKLQEVSAALQAISGSVFGYSNTRRMSNAMRVLSDAMYEALYAVGRVRGLTERYQKWLLP